MELYNIEIFDKSFCFVESHQIKTIKYKFDYLDVEKTKIEVESTTACEGNYLLTRIGDQCITGIINEISVEDDKAFITFQPFSVLFEVKIHCYPEMIEAMSLEEWIAKILLTTYKNNNDEKQNIMGFDIEICSETKNAVLTIDKNIVKLFDVITQAFFLYGILLEEIVDIEKKKILIKIRKEDGAKFYIEADMLNVVSKKFVVKKNDDFLNKITIVNEENEEEQEVFFLTESGDITQEDKKRILPVIFDFEFAKPDKERPFLEVAMEKAVAKMKNQKLNNLIELEVENDDVLVKPLQMQIGKEVIIIKKGIMYTTVLTGKEIDKKTKLIFGAIRLELTKNIKRRLA